MSVRVRPLLVSVTESKQQIITYNYNLKGRFLIEWIAFFLPPITLIFCLFLLHLYLLLVSYWLFFVILPFLNFPLARLARMGWFSFEPLLEGLLDPRTNKLEINLALFPSCKGRNLIKIFYRQVFQPSSAGVPLGQRSSSSWKLKAQSSKPKAQDWLIIIIYLDS